MCGVPSRIGGYSKVAHVVPRTIRVMMHFYGEGPRERVRHVYLEGARALRDDLPE